MKRAKKQKGIGVDIIEIDRIKEAVSKYGDSFLNRIFTPAEIKYCTTSQTLKYPELAVRFAAKEAYAKAIGTGIKRSTLKGGVFWRDIEVANDKHGKPFLLIKGKKNNKAMVSLSHSRDSAVAMVYVEK